MGRIFVLFLLALPVWAHAGWQQTLQQTLLKQWQAIGGDSAQASISLPSISASYQLPTCQGEVETSLTRPIQPGRNGVELVCRSPWWQQFVAVQLHVMQPVAILTRTVNSGEPIDAASIHFAEQDLGDLTQGYVLDANQLEHMEFRRNLRQGTVLSPDMMRPAQVIERGQHVRVLVVRGPIRIESRAEALGSGRMGKSLRVRNLRSGKVVSAIVVGPGEVEVR
ncbi:flagellar basal body P-ring formation chaperone FlgA [Oceanobacter kriegii]|uniref:flagellar basal body P-ring formation chaperone FlgA n=1 Tax=Oceanobacter kriegii TaxID=64972 RepID=UPI000A00574B|nr:flagellar basal body P-ring formation chaperone FlgA [Oceanobacter kriegii]